MEKVRDGKKMKREEENKNGIFGGRGGLGKRRKRMKIK